MDFTDLYETGGNDGAADNQDAGQGDDIFMFAGMDQDEVDMLRDQKDSVIFLIDCSKSMYTANPHNPNGTHNIDQVLKATLSFMKSKIITSDSDKISIILYGC